MSAKINQVVVAKNLQDGISVPVSEPGSGVAVQDQALVVRRARLVLSAAVVSVTEALDYGSLKICDLPDRNLLLLGVEVDLVVTKEGNTNGIVAATDLDLGIGTAAASATTLATTMIDIIEQVNADTDALAVDMEAHSNDQATAVFPKKIADGASTALYLNVVPVAGITADSSVSVTGYIDIFYIDLGNLSS
jgi:hypothetical protein